MANHVHIQLGEPVTVALAPPEVREWGPYQFPGLARLPDGRIQLNFHVEADSATAYGLPPAQAVSSDEGRSWQLLPREASEDGAQPSWVSAPLRLPNGDWLTARQLRSRPASALRLPAHPLATLPSYAVTHTYYRVEDLPAECRTGWLLWRMRAGQTRPVEEQVVVRIPGEVRCVTEDMLTFPWFQELFLAPDGSVWAVNYDHRIVNGKLREKICALILRSTDNGHTFDLWSEIPYAPDTAADPAAAQRDGFTEPTVCFMPDGSVLCLLRTTDGNGIGPLYWARSTDNGRAWSPPTVFDDLGVWPQMILLKNGVTLASYGRPGLYVRATADPAGLRWGARVTVVPPGELGHDTCSYSALLPLSDDSALLAYSDFNVRDAEGRPRKAICARVVTVVQR